MSIEVLAQEALSNSAPSIIKIRPNLVFA